MSGSRCSRTAAYAEEVSTLLTFEVAAAQTVVAITPENGGSLEQAPQQVELTYLRPLDGAEVSATTTGPDTSAVPADVEVEGSTVVVPVGDEGPGDYAVAVTVDGTTSSTGYTVLAAGERAPDAGVPSGPLVVGVMAAALLVVTVWTLRRWFRW